MFIYHIFYLLLIQSIVVHSELFTSTTHLIQLLNTEIELARQLESYLKEEYERLDRVEKYSSFPLKSISLYILLQRFLNIIKDEIRQAQGNEDQYFGNPVNAFLFIKHLTPDWHAIQEIVSAGNLILTGKSVSKQCF